MVILEEADLVSSWPESWRGARVFEETHVTGW